VTSLSERAETVLASFLGPHTARRAVAVACQRLGRPIDAITESEADELAQALLPMLRTLAGSEVAERLARAIAKGGP
jgi:hypothetical protein